MHNSDRLYIKCCRKSASTGNSNRKVSLHSKRWDSKCNNNILAQVHLHVVAPYTCIHVHDMMYMYHHIYFRVNGQYLQSASRAKSTRQAHKVKSQKPLTYMYMYLLYITHVYKWDKPIQHHAQSRVFNTGHVSAVVSGAVWGWRPITWGFSLRGQTLLPTELDPLKLAASVTNIWTSKHSTVLCANHHVLCSLTICSALVASFTEKVDSADFHSAFIH